MGTWGIGIKDNDTFADIYSDFFAAYNNGEDPKIISHNIIASNTETFEIEEEKNNVRFALALAQWETTSLDPQIIAKVEDIIQSGSELKIRKDLGASEQDIKQREKNLQNFLEKITSEKQKAKNRKSNKTKTPIFKTGDCLAFQMDDGSYGGAIVLATDTNPESACNLVATTNLHRNNKPTPNDIKNAEVIIRNIGEWKDQPDVVWYMPDLYHKHYSHIYTVIGNISVEFEYQTDNYDGKGYLFHPSWTAGWTIKDKAQKQFQSEIEKSTTKKILTIQQLIHVKKWREIL